MRVLPTEIHYNSLSATTRAFCTTVNTVNIVSINFPYTFSTVCTYTMEPKSEMKVALVEIGVCVAYLCDSQRLAEVKTLGSVRQKRISFRSINTLRTSFVIVK